MHPKIQNINRILLVGDFPPPVTGAAKNNFIVAQRMSDRFAVQCVDTSANSMALNRHLGYHWVRVLRNLKAALRLIGCGLTPTGHGTALYHVPNAGYGSVYTMILVTICWMLRLRCILHHRSFRYIDRPTRSMQWIVNRTSQRGLHVFLSQGMQDRFMKAYGNTVTASVVSNAAYVDVTDGHRRTHEGALVLGHLSNLCHEKGIDDVIATYRRLRQHRDDIHLLIGGPAMNAQVEASLKALQDDFGDAVTIVGKVQSEDKNRFYQQIDLFLFPTRYAVEAQPNVVFEALASGCPVAAFDRGCIAEMLGPESLLVATESDFAQAVEGWIQQFAQTDRLAERSEQALAQCQAQQRVGKQQLAEVMDKINDPIAWSAAVGVE